jgi:hypothetical protein
MKASWFSSTITRLTFSNPGDGIEAFFSVPGWQSAPDRAFPPPRFYQGPAVSAAVRCRSSHGS